MVIISGSPFNVEELMRDYSSDSVEHKILNIMASSSSKYEYDTLNQLKFELKLRKAIIKAANDLNSSGFDFEVFRSSRANPKYWDRTNEGGFSLKNGASPSEAINDIFVNGDKYASECATAMVIVYYKALLDVFGQSMFNRLFPKIYLMNWHYIDDLIAEVGYTRKAPDYFPGDRRYFSNPDVDPMTPEWQGENVIDLGNGYYYGHGVGIQDGKTIIQELNGSRRRGATRSAYLLDSAGNPDYKALSDIYQRTMG